MLVCAVCQQQGTATSPQPVVLRLLSSTAAARGHVACGKWGLTSALGVRNQQGDWAGPDETGVLFKSTWLVPDFQLTKSLTACIQVWFVSLLECGWQRTQVRKLNQNLLLKEYWIHWIHSSPETQIGRPDADQKSHIIPAFSCQGQYHFVVMTNMIWSRTSSCLSLNKFLFGVWMNYKKTATKPMKTKPKTFTYIMLILDIVKVLKMRISIGSLLRSSLAFCIQRTIFKLPGSGKPP